MNGVGLTLIALAASGLGGCYLSHPPPGGDADADADADADTDADADADADTDADADADADADETFDPAGMLPLAVGARWEYERVDYEGWPNETREITGCETITVWDCVTGESRVHSAFVQKATGQEAENDRYLALSEQGLVRVHQAWTWLQPVGFAPPFLRVPAGPLRVGEEVTSEFARCTTFADGSSWAEPDWVRFTMLGWRVVEVPAGVYDAVGVERRHSGAWARKRYWYAAGVGKVLEERVYEDGSVHPTEALVAYTPGAGSCP